MRQPYVWCYEWLDTNQYYPKAYDWSRDASSSDHHLQNNNIKSVLKALLFFFPGTLTVEEVYKDRDQFAGLVREVAAPDVGRMGIEILSFTIKDVYDDVEYLSSLGRAQTAVVKRDADIGVAQANRDAGIRVSIKSRTKLVWGINSGC